MAYILSIDQGTTGTTVALFNKSGQRVGSADCDFQQHFPQSGWVEHRAHEIIKSLEVALENLRRQWPKEFAEISGVGITNQRESFLFWDRNTGQALTPVVVWQCRRTEKRCAQLKARKELERKFHRDTGLYFDPYFSVTKAEWLLKNTPDLKKKVEAGTAVMGTMDSYLAFWLSGGKNHITDVTNASRTGLFNLKTLDWDPYWLKYFKIPQACLPKVVSSSGHLGQVSSKFINVWGLQTRTLPICSMVGDQQSALFGQAAFHVGQSKCTFGTGSFLLLNTGSKPTFSKYRLLTTVAWRLGASDKAVYALEGGAFICGAAVQWLRDGLGIIQKSSEVESLAGSVSNSGGVVFIPAFVGLGAPHWRSEVRGTLFGITRGTKQAHLAYATLEAMAHQNVDLLEAMQKDLMGSLQKSKRALKIVDLHVDGGAVANNLLMQIQANFSGVKVKRPVDIESTARGAAWLAGLALEWWTLEDLSRRIEWDRTFSPQLKEGERIHHRSIWQKALENSPSAE